MLLRRVRIADAPAIAAIYRPFVEETRVSFELVPPDADEMAARIAKCGDRYPWLVAENGDEIMGYAYATAFRDRPAYRFTTETSVYLAPSAQGAGLGRSLYGLLLNVLTAQGFVHAVGAVTLPNPASVTLHRSMGFVESGIYPHIGYKLGEWVGVQLFQKALLPLPVHPCEPLPLSACPAWTAIPG
ncbi:MAG: GNAT family N-acetyltransferase [Sphingobium sp.]